MKKPPLGKTVVVLLFLSLSLFAQQNDENPYIEQPPSSTPPQKDITNNQESVVTISDYSLFLNSVAASDPYHLFNQKMMIASLSGLLIRKGSPGNYTYYVVSGHEADPIFYVTKLAQACYCNWLQNGRLSGEQGEKSITDGAYTLTNLEKSSSVGSILKNSNASYLIANEDEFSDQLDPLFASNNHRFTVNTPTPSLSMMTPGEDAVAASDDGLLSEALLTALGISKIFTDEPSFPEGRDDTPPNQPSDDKLHPLETRILVNIDGKLYYDEPTQRAERLDLLRQINRLSKGPENESKEELDQRNREHDEIGSQYIAKANDFLRPNATKERVNVLEERDRKLIDKDTKEQAKQEKWDNYAKRLIHLHKSDSLFEEAQRYFDTLDSHILATHKKNEAEKEENLWLTFMHDDVPQVKQALEQKLQIDELHTTVQTEADKLLQLREESSTSEEQLQEAQENYNKAKQAWRTQLGEHLKNFDTLSSNEKSIYLQTIWSAQRSKNADKALNDFLKESDQASFHHLTSFSQPNKKHLDKKAIKEWKKKATESCIQEAEKSFGNRNDALFSLIFEGYNEYILQAYAEKGEKNASEAKAKYQQVAIKEALRMVREEGADGLLKWKKIVKYSTQDHEEADGLFNKAKEKSIKAFDKLSEEALKKAEKKTDQQKEKALEEANKKIDQISRSSGAVIGAAIGGSMGCLSGPFAIITAPVGGAIGGALGALSPEVATRIKQLLEKGANEIQNKICIELSKAQAYVGAMATQQGYEKTAAWATFFKEADSRVYEIAQKEHHRLTNIKQKWKEERQRLGREAITEIAHAAWQYRLNNHNPWNALPSQWKNAYNNYNSLLPSSQKRTLRALNLFSSRRNNISDIPTYSEVLSNIQDLDPDELPSDHATTIATELPVVVEEIDHSAIEATEPRTVGEEKSDQAVSNEEKNEPTDLMKQKEGEAETAYNLFEHHKKNFLDDENNNEILTLWLSAIEKAEIIAQAGYENWEKKLTSLLDYPLKKTYLGRKHPYEQKEEKDATQAAFALQTIEEIYHQSIDRNDITVSKNIKTRLLSREKLAHYRKLIYKAQHSLGEAHLLELKIQEKENHPDIFSNPDIASSLENDLNQSISCYENIISRYWETKNYIGEIDFSDGEKGRQKEKVAIIKQIWAAYCKQVINEGKIKNLNASLAQQRASQEGVKPPFLKNELIDGGDLSNLDLNSYWGSNVFFSNIHHFWEIATERANEAYDQWSTVCFNINKYKAYLKSACNTTDGKTSEVRFNLAYLNKALFFKIFYQIQPLWLEAQKLSQLTTIKADKAWEISYRDVYIFEEAWNQAIQAAYNAKNSWEKTFIDQGNLKKSIPKSQQEEWNNNYARAEYQYAYYSVHPFWLRAQQQAQIASISYEDAKKISFSRDGNNTIFYKCWPQAFDDALKTKEKWKEALQESKNYEFNSSLSEEQKLAWQQDIDTAEYQVAYWTLREIWLQTEQLTDYQAPISRAYAFSLAPEDQTILNEALHKALVDAKESVDKTSLLLDCYQEQLIPPSKKDAWENDIEPLHLWIATEKAHQNILLAYKEALQADPNSSTTFESAWKKVIENADLASQEFQKLYNISTSEEDRNRHNYWKNFYSLFPVWCEAQKATQLAIAKERENNIVDDKQKLVAAKNAEKAWRKVIQDYKNGQLYTYNSFIDTAKNQEAYWKEQTTGKLENLFQTAIAASQRAQELVRSTNFLNVGSSAAHLSLELKQTLVEACNELNSFIQFYRTLFPYLNETEKVQSALLLTEIEKELTDKSEKLDSFKLSLTRSQALLRRWKN